MNIANESQKENNFFPTDPPAQRASKTPFLMGIIWSIQCAVLFLPRREMQWLFVYCKQGFFWEQALLLERGTLSLFVHFARCFSVEQRFLLLFVHFKRCF